MLVSFPNSVTLGDYDNGPLLDSLKTPADYVEASKNSTEVT